MNRPMKFAICCLVLIVGGLLQAEEAPVLLPPKPPFLNNIIKPPAAWTIVYKAKNAHASSKIGDGAGGIVPDPGGPRVLKSIHFYKFDNKRIIISHWSDGTKSERWMFDGVSLSTYPGNPEGYMDNLVALPGSTPVETYSDTDFPEFRWLQASLFQPEPSSKDPSGQQRPHYFFRSVPPEIPTLPAKRPEHLPVFKREDGEVIESVLPQAARKFDIYIQQAWIDALTKLPIAYDDGEYLQIYSFDPNPPTSLEMPPQFSEIMAKRKASAEQMAKHMMH